MSADGPASSAPTPQPLPEQPSLELLKKRAKGLLRLARQGDVEALTRCRAA